MSNISSIPLNKNGEFTTSFVRLISYMLISQKDMIGLRVNVGAWIVDVGYTDGDEDK